MTNPDLCECIASHMRRMIQEFDQLMEQTADQTFTRGGQAFNGDPLAIGGDTATRVGGDGGGTGGLGTPAMLMLLFGFLYMFMMFVARPKVNRIESPQKPHRNNNNGGGGGFGGGPGPDLIM